MKPSISLSRRASPTRSRPASSSIEAKGLLKHGQWLPWLAEHCSISDRSAQLYMRIAKNREMIEHQIRNGAADLSLNQAAALLFLTSDMKKLLAFSREIEGAAPEEIVKACIENDIGVIRDPNYDMFAGRSETEIRDWHLFALFLVRSRKWRAGAAAQHIEWVLQRPFQNVAEWLGSEGDAFRARCWMPPIQRAGVDAWHAFAAAHTEKTTEEMLTELEREDAGS